MKSILAIAAVFSVLTCSAVNAASVSSIASASNPGVYSIYLDATAESGNFDTLFVKVLPDSGQQFTNVTTGNSGGLPRPSGAPFTYRNRALAADPLEVEGGLGWTELGVVNLATEISFTAGPLGAKITSPPAPGLFLANVQMPTGTGSYQVQVINAGALVQELTGPIAGVIIPEPATAGLAGLALCCVAAFRRRTA